LEVEAFVPDLIAVLGGDASKEQAIIERLITTGDGRDWLRYLRVRTDQLCARVEAGTANESTATLGAILADQFLLALGVREPSPEDAAALQRLQWVLPEAGARDQA
jgi:hypothetical protein